MTGTIPLTYSGIGLAVFAQQFCLPVPAMLLLMTAGALAVKGDGHLHLSLVLLASLLGCLAADGFWFWMGRRWGSNVIRLVCGFTSDPLASRKRACNIFSRWGMRLLLVAKFIPGLDGVSPPLAGAEGVSVRRFLAYDATGSLIWTVVYMMLGSAFSDQLDRVVHFIGRFGTVFGLVVGVPFVCYVAWRSLRLVRVIRHLRLRRISPAMLQRKLDEGHDVAIFDLLHYEARDGEIAGIPGAIRADPTRLRLTPRLHVPKGVDVVLYCSSRNEFASARVAKSLGERGFAAVWVLEGGLEAWVRDGRDVTTELSTAASVARRLGILLPPEMQEDPEVAESGSS